MALALSQSETQDVQVEVPLVDGDKENTCTLQAEGANEKSNEEGNISSDSINQANQDTPNLCKPCKE